MDKNDIVWFSENWARKLTRLDPRPGQFTQMPVEARSPVNSAGFGNFAVAPDGDIWAAEGGAVVSGGNIHPASRGLEALTRRIVREEPGGYHHGAGEQLLAPQA